MGSGELLEAVKIQNLYFGRIIQKLSRVDKDYNRRNNVRVEKRMIGLSMSWLDDVKAKTRLRLEKAMQAAADQDNCRRVAHDVTNPWTQDGYRTEQNRADILTCTQNILHQICTNWVIHHLVQN